MLHKIYENINLNTEIITSIKQTKWKKLNQFINLMKKNNIVTIKEMDSNVFITDINYDYLENHFLQYSKEDFFDPSQYDHFVNEVKDIQSKLNQNNLNVDNNNDNDDNKEKRKIEDNDNDANNKTNNKVSKVAKIVVDTMYRANSRLLPIFGPNHISELHPKNVAQNYFWSYIDANQLLSQDKKFVIINDELYHMLYESKVYNKLYGNPVDNNTQINSQVSRKSIVQLFEDHLEPYSAIILNDNNNEKPKYRAGFPTKIQISADKRQNNKFMTHVRNLESYNIDYKDFANLCKKQYACSTTIQEIEGKRQQIKGGDVKKEILIQGNICDQIPKLLLDIYNIDEKFIEVINKVGKQRKS